MTRDEAVDIIDTIIDLYPQFESEWTKRKSEIWVSGLMKMDFAKVMHNLEKHVAESRFPPKLAEIAGYPREDSQTLARIQAYEEKAKENPPTTEQRQVLQERLDRLLMQVQSKVMDG